MFGQTVHFIVLNRDENNDIKYILHAVKCCTTTCPFWFSRASLYWCRTYCAYTYNYY